MKLKLFGYSVVAVLLVGCQPTAVRSQLAGSEGDQPLDADTADSALQITEAESEVSASAVAALRDEALACMGSTGCDSKAVLSRLANELDQLSGIAVADETGVLVPDEEKSLPSEMTVNAASASAVGLRPDLHGEVKRGINEWLTWMRPQLVSTWENYQHLKPLMWPEYADSGLPESLLFAMLAKESAGKVHAVSRAGASGPLQFMPATGLRYGLGQSGGFDTRFDARLAARANRDYMSQHVAEFGGSLELALAAYNGGESRMRRLHQRHPGKGFWDPEIYWSLPAETRDYVPMVMAAMQLFDEPSRFGLALEPEDGEIVNITLVSEQSINELAICIGDAGRRDGWFRALRNLNPRYMAGDAIPAGTELRFPAAVESSYRAQCLQGPMRDLAIDIASAESVKPPTPKTYVVRRGDSLHAIARKQHCTVSALANANGVRAPRYMIRPGQKLSLAGCNAAP